MHMHRDMNIVMDTDMSMDMDTGVDTDIGMEMDRGMDIHLDTRHRHGHSDAQNTANPEQATETHCSDSVRILNRK